MTIAPRTFGLDVQFPFNPGNAAPIRSLPVTPIVPQEPVRTLPIRPIAPIQSLPVGEVGPIRSLPTEPVSPPDEHRTRPVITWGLAEQQAAEGTALVER